MTLPAKTDQTKSVRQGGRAYLAANMVSQASALIRYVILARLLGPEQLGLAAMLILTAQFFESISDTGSDRFLIQDEDGDSPVMQSFVQAVLAGRGVLIALALAAGSGLLASLYHAPVLQFSLVVLGIAPLIGGLVHLDLRRVQRKADFRPESLAMIVSETICLTVTAAAAVMTRDHTAVIYGLVLRALALVVVSHLTAKRPYRWGFGPEESRRFSLFALPLFLNGFLLFFGSQGDRLVVAGGLGATALGHYSAVLLLVFYPTSMLARYLTGIHLPQIASARANPQAFQAACSVLASRTLLLSVGVVAGFALVAPFFTPLFYGASFAQPLQVFALLGALQGARFLRLWPTTLAIGIGRSTIVLMNNVARMVAVPLALLAFCQFHTLEAVVGGFIVGELTALLVALGLLRQARTVALRRELVRVALFGAAAIATIGVTWSLQFGAQLEAGLWFAAGVSVAVALTVSELGTLRSLVRTVLRRPASA